ncbi:Flp pilus assembly protein CpaB [Phycicoccus sp. BSK3Z-2]|uniref:Flp pilus assembly protein CpaB n=1 Tax=Phycicoccus avicenniae TaxID=2828860 RepID=A0A941D710_9MICO|nr:Flp pilus assembly protein CpaB [Phycicoccus avicenniae]MBR7742631.1 Flp pilus assembly protein CpaB [Phycicoccus avicenniae]
MNPRQRRGLLFVLVSFVVAVGTFFAVSAYVANVNTQVGSRVTVYQARGAIEAYTPLGPDNLEAVEIPERWVPESSVLTLDELQGRRIGFRLNEGSTVSSDMLIPSSALSSTEREVAINVDAVTGVAGRVRPGDRVDIYAVFSEVPGLPQSVRILVRDVRIVSIAGVQTVTSQSTEGGTFEQDVIPVTLALEPDQALSVTFAAEFASQVRLVALPNDVGTNREGEPNEYDAGELGGEAVPMKAN